MARLQPPDVLGSISCLCGVIFPAPKQLSLVQWIENRLQNILPNQQLPTTMFDQYAFTFLNDLLTELDRNGLSETTGIIRQTNLTPLYTMLVNYFQSCWISQQVNILREMSQSCEQKTRLIIQIKNMDPTLLEDFKVILDEATKLTEQVIYNFLTHWKSLQNQQNDQDASSCMLNTIQSWCEALSQIAWSVRNQIKTITNHIAVMSDVDQLYDKTRELLGMLTTNTFIIQRQPPRVLKKGIKHHVVVRHLLGEELFHRMTNPQLTVAIVSEFQARDVQNAISTGVKSGRLEFEDAVLKFNEESRHLTATFRNLVVTSIKRSERRSAEAVTDEKFALLFHLKFDAGDLTYSIWTISHPMVVVVHGNQEPHAWATIIWDNVFAENLYRVPFEVEDQVSWNVLARTFNRKFTSHMQRPLTEENLHFLCEKATRSSLAIPVNESQLITRTQFSREMMSAAQPWTFWEWLYAAMKVIRDHLKDIWDNGRIIGFIEKSRAEELLNACQPGTFLLRFADSQLGKITIAFVEPNGQIQHINPFSANEISTNSKPNLIRDLHPLQFLYPNIPKAQAFENIISKPVVQPGGGYITTVPYVSLSNVPNQPQVQPAEPSVQPFSPINSLPMSVSEVEFNGYPQPSDLPPVIISDQTQTVYRPNYDMGDPQQD